MIGEIWKESSIILENTPEAADLNFPRLLEFFEIPLIPDSFQTQ